MKTGNLFRKIGVGCLLIGVVLFNAPAQKLTVDSLRCWLSYMASDEMNGRANGSEEIEKIATWLSDKFQKYGVIPLEGQKSLFQEYPVDGQNAMYKNVIGYIPAKNNKDNYSYIVLSAHFDHIGKRGIMICNGADDDASGIVTLLGIAKNIYENNVRLDCPIIFAAFSGEERGRLGSKYFCTSNIIPLNRAKLNINFELVGRSEENGKDKFYITGQAFGMGYIHSGKDKVKFIDFENLYSFVNYMTGFINYISRQEIKVECFM